MKKKTKIIISAVVALVVICGVIIGVVQHNNTVQAQVKHEKLIKTEKSNLKNAQSAVDKAYQTRNAEDITTATTEIKKLDDNQKKEPISS